MRLRQLGPAFIRHVEAYGQLAAAAASDVTTIAKARVALLAGGFALALSFVILTGATLIAAGWASPYRLWIAAGVLAALALGAVVCVAAAVAALPRSTHLQALQDEWRKDRAWLARGRRSETQADAIEGALAADRAATGEGARRPTATASISGA